ncbi:MAG TPA: phytanoyl-CoA dioxygenase family protein [Acidimicrobiales bacterium]|nr:phytanoyl-CoA dioxygenase family protein [Acidimicrobiales bacterium]
MRFGEQDRNFFETFGFLKVPGGIKNELGTVNNEFPQVFIDRDVVHRGTERTMVLGFIARREGLSRLLEHPVVEDLLECLLGPGANYIGSDGNYYTGDTKWHADGYHKNGLFIKVAFYLDPVDGESGALRVIPGSHRLTHPEWAARRAAASEELWNVPGDLVPATVLSSEPGDLLVFNHNLMHSSWGGSDKRRMFTINLCKHCTSPEEFDELKKYLADRERDWEDLTEFDVIRASPNRARRLDQVLDVRALLWPELNRA